MQYIVRMTLATQRELDWTQFIFEGSHGDTKRNDAGNVAQLCWQMSQDKKTKSTILPIPTSITILPTPFLALIVQLLH